jgi:hypothetical protein
MTATRRMALTICAFAIMPALAAEPVPLGDPFHVRHGESIELAHGVKLRFVDVTSEGRCPVDLTCVWQGEAFVEIELHVRGQTARASITTVKPDRILVGHGVKLLGLYPLPRESEQRPAKEYVAFFRVADTAPASANAFANRAAALAAAVRYVAAYTRSANQVCADWQQRRLASYIQDSSELCEMIAKVSRTAHAVSEDAGSWRFFFMIDNPQLRQQMHESAYLTVPIAKAPKHAFDQVRESDILALQCDVTLLDGTGRPACNVPSR